MREVYIPAPGMIQPIERTSASQQAGAARSVSGPSFQEILGQAQANLAAPGSANGALKFSAHAESRLRSRNIELSPGDVNQLASAVDRARAKGSRDSLILMRDVAYVVSVENRTVITAMDTRDAGNVFTNIDSAVIA